MADLFGSLAVGDCLDEAQAVIINAKCETAVTKGQIVIFNTHTSGEIPSVSTGGALGTNGLGVAMKSGVAGEVIPVGKKQLFKVTDSGAGVTGGVLIVLGAAGTITTIGANTFEKVVGRAWQTFGAGDTGLAWID
jgi:hypothetical protein